MQTFFLVLQRFFLRVDNVLVKLVDTRIFHEFGTRFVIREFKVREMPYSDLVKLIPTNGAGERDLSIVNNDGWVSSVMGEQYVTDLCLESMTLPDKA
jgi:type 2A phosphatase activator TIP41